MAAEITRARCLWWLAVVFRAAVLTTLVAETGRVLGPMVPASARERWPYFVVRDSCHAALRD